MPEARVYLVRERQVFSFTKPDRARKGWSDLRSIAFWCPRCAEVWAIAQLEGREEVLPEPQLCSRHPPEWYCPCPGSLILGIDILDSGMLEGMPEPLLRREALLCLAQVKENENGQEGV
jgi:hypothetical protein